MESILSANIDTSAYLHYRAVLEKAGRLCCRVISDSMVPVLQIDDMIEIEPIRDLVALKKFDIIVFHTGDRLYCHYVWNLNRLGKRPSVTTRSLKNCLVDDIPADKDAILGRVTSHRIPSWLKASVVFQNLLRKTA